MATFDRARRTLLQSAAGLVLLAGGARAQDKSNNDRTSAMPVRVTRDFTGAFNGERLNYLAEAGEIILTNDKGEPRASIFSIAYLRKGTQEASRRPVTFLFNGGPGSASLWLHLGAFGPKRVVVPEDGNAGAAPYALVDNPDSILDVTDLVFIDPVGSGYSRARGEAKDEDFWGLQADARSIAAFIRRWLTEHGRWNSPKYICGESYGTTRTAQIVQEIQTGFDAVTINGVVLVASILDFHTVFAQRGNDLPYIGYLPTYAATAWYHGRITPKPPALEPFLDEVRRYAQETYSVALLKGSALPESERAAVVKQLAAYTGLAERYVAQANLRVDPSRFMKELLRESGRTVGRFDSRYLGQDYDSAGESYDTDPSLTAIAGAFATTIHDYVTRVLQVGIDGPYKILEGEISGKWKWSERSNPVSFVNVAPHLGQAMRENRDFRVFVASGYYDLATPFFATEISLANNGIDLQRVTHRYYEAGHMMYTHTPSRQRLGREVRAFIASARS